MKQLCSNLKQKNRYPGNTIFIAVCTMVLLLGVNIQQSLAYFTTYVTAKGGYAIQLDHNTMIQEEFNDWKKLIQIENTGKMECFVRVKVLAGKEFTITAKGKNWSQGEDGYWYYGKSVPAGQKTEELVAAITYPKDQEKSFNVVVVQECTPMTYDADGKPRTAQSADWSLAAQKGEEANP